MSAVKVSNRQRKLSIDSKHWTRTTDALFKAVCANLSENRPAHISKKHLKLISERGSLELMFVTNKVIKEMNKQFREKDSPTDVLSFPLIFDGEAVDFPPDFGQEHFELGEVVISVERAEEQASDFGHTFEREIAFLFVHGVLHILGFDHMTDAQEKDMFGRQKVVLDACGISR